MQKIMVGNLTAYKPILEPLPITPTQPIAVDGFFVKEPNYNLPRDEFRQQIKIYEQKIKDYASKIMERPLVFKNNKQIETFAKNNDIEIDNINEIDLQVFNDLKEPIEIALKKYPQIKEYYKMFGKKFKIYLFDGNGIAEADFGVGLNRKYFTDYTKGVEIGANNKGTNFTVTGDGTPKTIIYHEIGHTLQSYIEKKQIDYNNKTKGLYYKENEITKPTDLFRAFMSRNIDNVSEYAKTNDMEFFAECFAETMTNQKSELSKEFTELLDNMLEIVDNYEV